MRNKVENTRVPWRRTGDKNWIMNNLFHRIKEEESKKDAEGLKRVK